MSKLTLSRCAGLVAVFGVLGGLLAVGPSWGVPSASAQTALGPVALNGLVALAFAVIGGGWLLAQSRVLVRQGVVTADTRGLCLDEAGAAVLLLERREEADAIAAAMRIFQDGLIGMGARKVPAPAADTTGSLAAVAAQTSLMALRATMAATQGAAAGGGYRAAAARVRNLAEQAARASEAIAAQADREAVVVRSIADLREDVHAASVSIAAVVDPREAAPPQAGIELPSAKPRRFSRSTRAA